VVAWLSPGEPYEAVTVSEGGTIKGKVIFQGSPPDKRKVILTKDREVCGSGVREVDQILVGPDKAVQDAVVYLKNVAKGKAWERLSATPHIDNVKCDFKPHVQVIPAGDFEIVNSDPVAAQHAWVLREAHRVQRGATEPGSAHQAAAQEVGARPRGVRRPRLDARLGPRRGQPLLRGDGEGRHVHDQGRPPGSYTLAAWQEYTGEVEIPVSVKAKEVVPVTAELKK